MIIVHLVAPFAMPVTQTLPCIWDFKIFTEVVYYLPYEDKMVDAASRRKFLNG